MTEFINKGGEEIVTKLVETNESKELESNETIINEAVNIPNYIDVSKPLIVKYCPHCSFPPEYCEYGALYNEKCLPWILENCQELLSESNLSELMGETNLDDEDDKGDGKKKKKRAAISLPKKKAPVEIKVVLQLVQRQKKKMLTVVTGLETVPDLKIKDASRVFGKKFSSGTSIGDTPTGGKEVVIQGDVMFQLPDILISEFKIPSTNIFINEGGTIRPF